MCRARFFLLALVLILPTRPVLAHDGDPQGAGEWWSAWSLEPAVILLLAGTVLVYARGWRVLSGRGGGTTRLPRATELPKATLMLRLRAWAFGAGMAVLAVALLSPVDGLADDLFWVHMLQHSLLILAAAPLLVLATPLPPLLLGLPEAARRGIGQGWARSGGLRALWRLLSSPLAAWLLQAFLLWVWHAPLLYQASVANDWIHALQHFSFLGSALLFWWVTVHTYAARPAYRGMGILYLFTAALQSSLLGALITFSPRVLYPVYTGRAEVWGISALADQQLAGTIMWVPDGMVYLAAALWMMKAWLDSIESPEKGVQEIRAKWESDE